MNLPLVDKLVGELGLKTDSAKGLMETLTDAAGSSDESQDVANGASGKQQAEKSPKSNPTSEAQTED